MTQDPDADRREGGGVEGADLRRLRVSGGPKLPGLKLRRVRSGLTQRELAYRGGVPLHYVQRIEQGKRGCNPQV